jgi:flagellar basal body P-ring formation protein FlgA
MKNILTVLSLLFFFSVSIGAEEERLVRLKSEVRVSGRFVLLKDLLISDANVTELEGKLIIIEAPERGSKKVTPRSIAYKMQEHKSLMDLGIMAPPLIKLIRVADVNFVEHVKDEITLQLKKTSPWSDFEIQIELTDEDINVISDMTGADKITLLSQKPARDLSRTKMRVSFFEKGKALGTITLTPTVQREIEIVILKDSVTKGSIITASSIKLSKIWSTGGEESLCMSFKEALGYEARRNMAEGSSIPVNYLTDPVYANKGEIIDVELVVGTLSASIKAKALQQGRRGDDIRALNTRTGKTMTVKMIRDGIGLIN